MPSTLPITVITPNLNGQDCIERCICSVLDQGYPAVEHYITDGGSTDLSVELVRLYEDALAGWRSGPDDGPATAINWALAKAGGTFVVILPSSAALMPGALHAIAKAHADNPEAAWLAGYTQLFDETDEPTRLIEPRPTDLVAWLMHDAPALGPASAYRRELFAQHGPLDASQTHAWAFEFHARLLSAGVEPAIVRHEMAAVREAAGPRDADAMVRRGMQEIAVAERYLEHVDAAARARVENNLDERRQIFAIAEAEAAGAAGAAVLWDRLLDRPWWISSDRYRRAMRRLGVGVGTPAAQHERQPAPRRRAA